MLTSVLLNISGPKINSCPSQNKVAYATEEPHRFMGEGCLTEGGRLARSLLHLTSQNAKNDVKAFTLMMM